MYSFHWFAGSIVFIYISIPNIVLLHGIQIQFQDRLRCKNEFTNFFRWTFHTLIIFLDRLEKYYSTVSVNRQEIKQVVEECKMQEVNEMQEVKWKFIGKHKLQTCGQQINGHPHVLKYTCYFTEDYYRDFSRDI